MGQVKDMFSQLVEAVEETERQIDHVRRKNAVKQQSKIHKKNNWFNFFKNFG